ncbi:MAG: holo-[acyl-carrier-protein] synthase [Elusimicrobia bacterium RIFCSPHIGHO2_02_FULL_57_9]|nr:MAG: holo-[acyl-carrier-protein] synthase [Elusimicrobia bacterium RIFCSPHIGHO2_02_FULL_57_9]
MDALAIGLDIIEIDRVKKLARRNPRFLSRVFTPAEIAYCRAKKKQWQHFAVRFAAKEAVWKALNKAGLISLRDISVSRDRRGKPGVILQGKPARGFMLSLSHSQRYAMAVALRAG